MKLSLKLPDEITYNEFIPIINSNNPNMTYWINSYYNFCKTTKPNTPKYYNESLVQEKKILSFLEDKEYTKCISPPSKCEEGPRGNLIIIQKAFYEGDLLQYIQNGNSGMETGIAFLQSIKLIFDSLEKLKITHGDLCLENFMIDTSSNKLECILIDFGCSEIYYDNKKYLWNLKNYEETRPYMNSPDLNISYSEEKEMSRDDIFDLLLKKEMFSAGVLLYNVVFGLSIWISDKDFEPENKLQILKNVRTNIELNYRNCECLKLKKVFEILLNLLPIKLKDMVSLDKLSLLIDDLSKFNYRKRKFSN